MAHFTLDTSGYVEVGGVRVGWEPGSSPSGFYLPFFTQGYVGATLIAAAARFAAMDLRSPDDDPVRAEFRRLDPAALEAMMADCAAFASSHPGWDHKDGGLLFYRSRANSWREWPALHMAEMLERFPPVTLYLDDAGKVAQR